MVAVENRLLGWLVVLAQELVQMVIAVFMGQAVEIIAVLAAAEVIILGV